MWLCVIPLSESGHRATDKVSRARGELAALTHILYWMCASHSLPNQNTHLNSQIDLYVDQRNSLAKHTNEVKGTWVRGSSNLPAISCCARLQIAFRIQIASTKSSSEIRQTVSWISAPLHTPTPTPCRFDALKLMRQLPLKSDWIIETKEWMCTLLNSLRELRKLKPIFWRTIRPAGEHYAQVDPPESLAEPWSATRLGRPGTAWVVRYQTAWSTSVAWILLWSGSGKESVCLSTSMRTRCWPAYGPPWHHEARRQHPLAASSVIASRQFLGQI